MATREEIKQIVNQMTIGGHNNVVDYPPVAAYNPQVDLEYTLSAPYKLYIHERFRGVHLVTEILLDAYKGNAVTIYPQEVSSDP